MLYNSAYKKDLQDILQRIARNHVNLFLNGKVSCIFPSVADLQSMYADYFSPSASYPASEMFREMNRLIYNNCDFKKYSPSMTFMYGLLTSDFVYVYNKVTDKFELHTASYRVLYNLRQGGHLNITKESYERLISSLNWSDAMKRSIKEGTWLNTVRLDLVSKPTDSTCMFNAVIPKTKVELENVLIIPFTCYSFIIKYLKSMIDTKIMRVVMEDDKKSELVTNDVKALELLLQRKIKFKYSSTYLSYLRYYGGVLLVPSYSKETSGLRYVSIRPEHLDSIVPYEKELSQRNTSINAIYVVYTLFEKSLDRLSEEQLKSLVQDWNVPYHKRGYRYSLLKWAHSSSVSSDSLLLHMKKCKLFDMSMVDNLYQGYCNGYTPRNLVVPRDRNDFYTNLSTGIFRIEVKKGNEVKSYLITNNRNKLRRIKGTDYKFKYEPMYVRRNWMLSIAYEIIDKRIKQYYDIPVSEETYKQLESCGIALSDSVKSGIFGYRDLCNYLLSLDVSSSGIRPSNIELFYARNCQAWYDDETQTSDDYYLAFNVKDIKSLVKISDAQGEPGYDIWKDFFKTYIKGDLFRQEMEEFDAWLRCPKGTYVADLNASYLYYKLLQKDFEGTPITKLYTQGRYRELHNMLYTSIKEGTGITLVNQEVKVPTTAKGLFDLLQTGLFLVADDMGTHYVSNGEYYIHRLVPNHNFVSIKYNEMTFHFLDRALYTLNIIKSKGRDFLKENMYKPAYQFIPEDDVPQRFKSKYKDYSLGELYYQLLADKIKYTVRSGNVETGRSTLVKAREVYATEYKSGVVGEFDIQVKNIDLWTGKITRLVKLL